MWGPGKGPEDSRRRVITDPPQALGGLYHDIFVMVHQRDRQGRDGSSASYLAEHPCRVPSRRGIS